MKAYTCLGVAATILLVAGVATLGAHGQGQQEEQFTSAVVELTCSKRRFPDDLRSLTAPQWDAFTTIFKDKMVGYCNELNHGNFSSLAVVDERSIKVSMNSQAALMSFYSCFNAREEKFRAKRCTVQSVSPVNNFRSSIDYTYGVHVDARVSGKKGLRKWKSPRLAETALQLGSAIVETCDQVNAADFRLWEAEDICALKRGRSFEFFALNEAIAETLVACLTNNDIHTDDLVVKAANTISVPNARCLSIPVAWVVSEPLQSCAEACASRMGVCNKNLTNAIDTAGEVEFVASQAGKPCSDIKDITFDFSYNVGSGINLVNSTCMFQKLSFSPKECEDVLTEDNTGRFCCCDSNPLACPQTDTTTDWKIGIGSCDGVCTAAGKECNIEPMVEVDTLDEFHFLASELGVECTYIVPDYETGFAPSRLSFEGFISDDISVCSYVDISQGVVPTCELHPAYSSSGYFAAFSERMCCCGSNCPTS